MAHMILENDNIVYAGAVPWHGIGISIPPTFTANEAMMAAGLNWNVELMDLAFVRNQQAVGVMPDHLAVVRTDKMIPLGVTSDRYKPLQNSEGFDVFQHVLDTGMASIETAGSLKNGAIVWALAQIKDVEEEIVSKDTVKMYVLMSFGHDGKRAIRIGYTPIRVVCNNTLTVAENNNESKLVRVLHRGNVVQNVQALTKSMDLAAREFRMTTDQYRFLASRAVNREDLRQYVKTVLELNEDSTRSKNIIDFVMWKADHGIGNQESAGSWWSAYNSITEYLNHDAGRNVDNRFSSLWFGKNATVNKTALTEALRMAA